MKSHCGPECLCQFVRPPSENVTRYTPTGTPVSSWARRWTVAVPTKVTGSTGATGESLDRKIRMNNHTRRSGAWVLVPGPRRYDWMNDGRYASTARDVFGGLDGGISRFRRALPQAVRIDRCRLQHRVRHS